MMSEKQEAVRLPKLGAVAEREMESSVFPKSESKIAVRQARGHTRERWQWEKSELEVTLEIIHWQVTIEGT